MKQIIFLLLSGGIAYGAGVLISKLKLPAILGWLITGMLLGPHALGLLSQSLLDAQWYRILTHVMECTVGLLIGTELIWSRMKKAGKQILVMTLTESIGTFVIVGAVFAVVCHFIGMPVYLAWIFGGIALATAPAPSLSIVQQMRTDGPVTRTLIPMAALDDMVGALIFFSVMAMVSANLAGQSVSIAIVFVIVLFPLLIGFVTGGIAGWLMRRISNPKSRLLLLFAAILVTSGVGFFFNAVVLGKPLLNFMLIGMAFSATIANLLPEADVEHLMQDANPIVGICMIFVILNLGAPLDYHLILGAGLYTALYILSRAVGKYGGAYLGAICVKAPHTVKQYLGLTLLPHSGVSLVFTGIAVSVLSSSQPEAAHMIQGTIAAAAVINEIIAVLLAKKGFEWAGETKKEQA